MSRTLSQAFFLLFCVGTDAAVGGDVHLLFHVGKQTFGPLPPGVTCGLSLMLGDGVVAYRLSSVMTLDDTGYPLTVMDDTATLASLAPTERRQDTTTEAVGRDAAPSALPLPRR